MAPRPGLKIIALNGPGYPKIAALITDAQRIIAEMNIGYRDPGEVRALFERLTGAAVHGSFWLLPPFYTDFGKNIPWRDDGRERCGRSERSG